jgi:hypothetical protein
MAGGSRLAGGADAVSMRVSASELSRSRSILSSGALPIRFRRVIKRSFKQSFRRFLAAFEPAQAGKAVGDAECLVDRQSFIGQLREHADRAEALQRSACRFDLACDQAKQCGFAAAVAADKAGALAPDRERQSIEQRASVRGGEGDGIENEKGRHGELPKMDWGREARSALRCPFLSPEFPGDGSSVGARRVPSGTSRGTATIIN